MSITPRPQCRRQRKAKTETPTLPKALDPVSQPQRKIDAVVALLRRSEGATLDDIVSATGWQRHSARGALAAAVPKKLNASVAVEVVDGVRRYRAPENAQ